MVRPPQAAGQELWADLRAGPSGKGIKFAPTRDIYSVELALRQQIQLARARTIESFAITWSEPPAVGRVEPAQLSAILDAVRAKVDQFIAAWQAANPD